MEDSNSTLLRSFFEGIGPIKKQNRCGLVGNYVCVTVDLNHIILGEGL